jgi:hypothetical protein
MMSERVLWKLVGLLVEAEDAIARTREALLEVLDELRRRG